jgi:tRNA/tmRNA/rRNA uracil-C5-methylase (TrmA/RlmC/RlmD family)
VAAWLEAADVAPENRVIYTNPPRTGLEADVLTWMVGDCRPARLAYLSCSAGTLERDLRRLSAEGFEVTRITPYDFFPQTRHVETLALLSRVHD